MLRVADGYAVDPNATRGWFDLREGRGLAGYGLSRALRMLLDVLSGVCALHDTQTEDGAGFVHGEVVPALLRVDPRGVTRLVPFAPWHWSKADVSGAPARIGHLAPERLLGDALEQRADVFSAGVLLWEALAGGRLFESESIDSIVMRLLGGRVNLPELPAELAWAAPLKSIAMRALAVDPQQRFADCAELSAAIEAVAGERVARHADVAAFFGAPALAPRATLSAAPARPLNHHSSLSALVSPLRSTSPAQSSPALEASASPAPASRSRARVWAAVGLSLCVAASVVLVSRYRALGSAHERAASAGIPLSRAPVASQALPLVSTALMPSAAPAPASAPVPSTAPALEASAAIPPASPAPTGHGKAGKSLKTTKGANSPIPTLKAPAKVTPGRDKAADQYGI